MATVSYILAPEYPYPPPLRMLPAAKDSITIHARILIVCYVLITLLSVTRAAPSPFIAYYNASSSRHQQQFDNPSPQIPLSAAPPFIAYHGASSSYHQQQFNNLSPQGWRMISLSVYGDLSHQLYAVVWVKPNVVPTWAAIHGATESQYRTFLINCAWQGLHPILLTAAGSGSQVVFAGTCEARSGPIPLTHLALTSGDGSRSTTIQHWDQEAHTQGYLLTSGAIYGTLASPQYAGIWSRNEGGVLWNAFGIEDDSAGYQARFNAETAGWGRPSFVTLSSYQRYLSVFVDNQIGPWVARHGLTSSQYQSEFNKWISQGFFPFSVQAGGFGSDARFAVLFAQNNTPLPRVFTASGPKTVAAIDTVIGNYMRAEGVRGATLGVVNNTRLLYAKGYTWAESGYPLNNPQTTFRVASCSKTVTSIAIHQLIQERLLSLKDRVQDILHLKMPSGGDPIDSRWNSITIQNLLERTSGLPESGNDDVAVAQAFGVSLPITKMQLARWMTLKKLIQDPGSKPMRYLNFDYILLSLVIESKRRTSFVRAIASHINSPLGITNLILSRTLLQQQPSNEARYHDSQVMVGLSVMSNGRPLVPIQYGGGNIENIDGAGGLSISGTDVARVLAGLNRGVLLKGSLRSEMIRTGRGWDPGWTSRNPDGTWHAVKGGGFNGLQSIINYNEKGVSYFIAWNKDGLKGQFYPNFPELEAVIAATIWGGTDLFKFFDLSSL